VKRAVLFVAGAVVLGLVIGLYSWIALFASSSTSNIEGPSTGYLTDSKGNEMKIWIPRLGSLT
jgi:hypothetical protein